MAQKPIFDKVLIANRGEIACRVAATCRRLGIKTVAIHSTADEHSKHVRMCDEAVCVGPPASKDSYLRIDRILDACLKLGVTAVHPGYGFLSENASFSADLKKNNVIFIGPDAHAIDAMGDKIHSKKLAKEANVTTIPGYIGEITNHEQLLKVSNEIGYPVMVKASGGGGGKGMKVANNDAECVEFFEMCKAEAASAFGNDKMLVEKFIESPRHIEIQIIADRKGNTLYLPERECSIQRRNQKVLEEAPSMFIDPETRKHMGEEAAAMARKVDYVTAGTVEMVVDPKRKFYFLEMNTRLQVEHPITELITGIDLVEQMIRAAAGLELSVKQEDIKINGWATEARVYAEDPIKNFFPSIGRLTAYEEPRGEGVRVDSGILDGSQISVYYDPLIAKLCAWGPTRDQSLARLRHALDEYVIRGLRHNVCLLRDVICQDRYISGKITTNYLKDVYGDDGFNKASMTAEEKHRLLLVAATLRSMHCAAEGNVNAANPASAESEYVVNIAGEREQKVDVALHRVSQDGDKAVFTTPVDGNTLTLTVVWDANFPVAHVKTEGGGKSTSDVVQFFGTDNVTYKLQFMGTVFDLQVLTPQQDSLYDNMVEPSSGVNVKHLLSPMPGVIVDIAVKPGDTIVAGAELLTLEAMKMRNKLRAELDGVVKSIKCSVNATVADEDILIEFE